MEKKKLTRFQRYLKGVKQRNAASKLILEQPSFQAEIEVLMKNAYNAGRRSANNEGFNPPDLRWIIR